MSKHASSLRRLGVACEVTGLVAFILIMVGVLSPAWSVSQGTHNYTLQEGIWYAKACPSQGGSCVLASREWIFEHFGLSGAVTVLKAKHWQVIRLLTVCAMEGALNAVLAAAVILVKRGKHIGTIIIVVGLVSSLASCILVIIPVFKVNQVTESTWYSDWSRTVTCVGGVLELMCTVSYVFVAAQNCLRILKHKDDDDDDDDSETNDNAIVYERDSSDTLEGMVNPGLELPAYSEVVSSLQPPPYLCTELVDFQPQGTDVRAETSERDETPS